MMKKLQFSIVDDDPAMKLLVEALEYRGHVARRFGTVAEALAAIKFLLTSDVVVLDLLLPAGDNGIEPGEHVANGMKVYQAVRVQNVTLPVFVRSAIQDQRVIDALLEHPDTRFFSKWDAVPLKELIAQLCIAAGAEPPSKSPLKTFIVHGHNETAKLELKNFLQNTLHLPEPTILHEMPSLGRTIIEKFEDHALEASLVFVLLTGDDIGAPAASTNDLKRRARQNVIFEMGYFLGVLGRRSGQVVLLHAGDIELPNDLSGIIYVDISKGVPAAGEEIRKEIAHVLSR